MTTLIVVIFWSACFLVVYPYVIYPLIMLMANRLGWGGRSAARFANQGMESLDRLESQVEKRNEESPSVSMIVAAYNEEAVIGGKIENALHLNYPGAFEIIVVSDGSTDDTAAIVREYALRYENVKLVDLPTQSGKTVGLNTAVPQASGEIIVFTDANAFYAEDALTHLVSPFSEDQVGYTVGSALYLEEDVEAVNVSEGLYWRYELAIKKLESDFYSVVGGDGAIYAIRKKLYEPLEFYEISDFVNPLQIAAKHYRGVFVPEARSYEHGTDEFSDEFRRKRRIVNRSWGAVRRNRRLFSWRQHPQFIFMLFSHKVIRWWSFPLVMVAAIAVLLAVAMTHSVLYWLLMITIFGSLAFGILGWQLDERGQSVPKMVYLLYYFYLVGIAGMLGIADELRGRRQATWQPSR